jgi:hypothetical protein
MISERISFVVSTAANEWEDKPGKQDSHSKKLKA